MSTAAATKRSRDTKTSDAKRQRVEEEDRQDEEINVGTSRELTQAEQDMREKMWELYNDSSAEKKYTFSYLGALYDFVEFCEDNERVYEIEEGGRVGFLHVDKLEGGGGAEEEGEEVDGDQIIIQDAGMLPMQASTVNLTMLLDALDEIFRSRANAFERVSSVYLCARSLRHFVADESQRKMTAAAKTMDVKRLIATLVERGYEPEYQTDYTAESVKVANKEACLEVYCGFCKERELPK